MSPRTIAAEDLARGFSANEQNGVLEVAIHKPGFFLQLSIVPYELGFDPVRLVHDDSNEGWLIAKPVRDTWLGVDTAFAPSLPADQPRRSQPWHSQPLTANGAVSDKVKIAHDDDGVSVAIDLEHAVFIKLQMVLPDRECQPIMIGWDSDGGGWSFQVPKTMRMLEERMTLYIPRYREVAFVRPGQVVGPPDSPVGKSGARSRLREMLKPGEAYSDPAVALVRRLADPYSFEGRRCIEIQDQADQLGEPSPTSHRRS